MGRLRVCPTPWRPQGVVVETRFFRRMFIPRSFNSLSLPSRDSEDRIRVGVVKVEAVGAVIPGVAQRFEVEEMAVGGRSVGAKIHLTGTTHT